MLSLPDFSGQGIPVDNRAMKPPADLPPAFAQQSLLRSHGFTAEELGRMSPAEIAHEYAQAVREGAQPPGGAQPEAHRRQLQAEADQAVHTAKQAAHIRAMQKAADHAVRSARAAHVRSMQSLADEAVAFVRRREAARRRRAMAR